VPDKRGKRLEWPHERRQDGDHDSKDGEISSCTWVRVPARAAPATAPTARLWITSYGNGKLAHVDPAAVKVIKEYEMPAGTNGGP